MTNFTTSLRLFVISLIVCSAAYPATILGFAALAASEARQGSLIRNEQGTVIGSRLLAQNFTRPEYFWPRPSAVDYDASGAGGSNLSPTNPVLTEQAREIIDRLKPQTGELVSADLVSASGSGLDPHISLDGAIAQIPRVATSRAMGENELRQFVEQHARTSAPAFLGGEPLVNVLLINLALDETYPTP